MRFTRSARIALLASLALGLSSCSTEDPVEAQTLIDTLVNVGEVEPSEARCAADTIFGPDSGFTLDQIKEAEVDMASVPGFEEFALQALRDCGAVASIEGPVLEE